MNASSRAERLRARLRLSVPLDVDALADQLVVPVREVDWPPVAASHPSAAADGVVFVSRHLDRRRRRECVAHELYHALYDALDQRALRARRDVRLAQMERRATAFADELLMPMIELLDVAHWPLEDAACWFGVRPETLVARWHRAV